MRTTQIIAGLLLAATPMMHSCKGKGGGAASGGATDKNSVKQAQQDKADEENRKKVDELNNQYPKIPEDRLLDNGDNTPVYNELKKRYKDGVATLKKEVEATGAKLFFVIITPELGKGTPMTNKYGIPAIKAICAQEGVECIDFGPFIAAQDVKVITQVPKDGHWSMKGSEMIAAHMLPMIKKYYGNTSTKTYKPEERPETFADLIPNDDEILDGGKDLPYHLKVNSQGIRMDYDIKFPKKKKRILLLGDSGFYCPFLNNEYTISANLEKMLGDAEVLNTGVIAYTIDDYVTLWNEKAKYTEPDIVVVQTNGGDILDLFFSQRNHLGRTHKPYYPSPTEEKFYKDNYAR